MSWREQTCKSCTYCVNGKCRRFDVGETDFAYPAVMAYNLSTKSFWFRDACSQHNAALPNKTKTHNTEEKYS